MLTQKWLKEHLEYDDGELIVIKKWNKCHRLGGCIGSYTNGYKLANRAGLKKDGVYVFRKHFKTELEAVHAYNKAAKELRRVCFS
jgi:hypothetical protein